MPGVTLAWQELSENPKWAQRIIVCVSHDRAFLDDVTTDQLHISGAARRLAQVRTKLYPS